MSDLVAFVGCNHRSVVDAPLFFSEFVLLSLLAGILAVDERAGWQGLLSQPVVAGTLAGVLIGEPETGMAVGVVLELIFLSVMPMRGTRRADGLAGGIVGAGTACMLLHHTGDPRFFFVTSTGVLVGLIAAEVAPMLTGPLNRFRDRTIGGFQPVDDPLRLVRKLGVYHTLATAYHIGVEGLVVLVMLPVAVASGHAFTGLVEGPVNVGATTWLELLPGLGVAALIQTYWQKHAIRFLVLVACVTWVVLWIR